MPTYDYICTACGHEMEVVHGIHGHGPEACPVCGGVLRKGFAAPAVHFKGSGWAKKDRGAAARTKAAAKAGGSDAATTAGRDDHGDPAAPSSAPPSSSASAQASAGGSGSGSGSSGDRSPTVTEPKAKPSSPTAGTD